MEKEEMSTIKDRLNMHDNHLTELFRRVQKTEDNLYGTVYSPLLGSTPSALKTIAGLEKRLDDLVDRYEETHRLLEREGYRIVEDVWIKPSEITSGALDLAMIHRDHGRKIYEQEAVAKGRNLET